MVPKGEGMFIGVGILLMLVVLVNSTAIYCQHQKSSRINGLRYDISERYNIVQSMYDGVDMVTDSLDGAISRQIRDQGTWEPRSIRAMARFVKPGDSVLNLGAHIGSQAIVLGHVAGTSGRLYIFEPMSITHDILLKNVFMNGLGWTTSVYHVGCGNKFKKGDISIPEDHNTGGSVIFYDDVKLRKGHKRSEPVITDKVDSILPNDTVLDFALIDVERMEIECLEGMKETILRSPNLIMLIEWLNDSVNTPGIKDKIKPLLEWFVGLGYKFYVLSRTWPTDCKLQHFTEITKEEVAAITNMIDVLFVPSHMDPNTME